MAIPDFQTIMLPLLRFAADGREHTLAEARSELAEEFSLSADEVEQRLPSGRQRVFANRVSWAKVYLTHGGLLDSPRRGAFTITDRGRATLRENPDRVDIRYLKQFPDFVAFRSGKVDDEMDEDVAVAEELEVDIAGATRAILGSLRAKYPGWNGVSHPPFVDDEIDYKRAAAAKARELLDRDTLRDLVEDEKFDEIVGRLERVGRATNLLYQGVPRQGDLKVLYDPKLDRAAFAGAFFDLVYGEGDSPIRLGRYLRFLKASDLPNKWTFPTYFLFLCHPKTEIFVKPRTTQAFLKLIGREDAYSAKPTADAYEQIRDIAMQLKAGMAEFGVRDLIDVQSVMWVAAQETDVPQGLQMFLAEHCSPERLEKRREAEAAARSIIESKLGRFEEADFRELFRLINVDWKNGKDRRDRFGPALTGQNLNLIVEQAERANEMIKGLWRCQDPQLHDLLNDYLGQKDLRGGRIFPSMILYLRDPEQFTPWTKELAKRASMLTGDEVPVRRTASSYEKYNDVMIRYCEERDIPPEFRDLVIAGADEIRKDHPIETSHFSATAFDLLEGLGHDPTQKYYSDRKESFQKEVETPLRELMESARRALPPRILRELETGKGIFGKILKNDYGRGGAWPFYWGAFYPKDGKRTRDAQLYAWVNGSLLDVGFSIGAYGSEQRRRFAANCKKHADVVRELMESRPGFDELTFGRGDGTSEIRGKAGLDLEAWMADPDDPRVLNPT